MIESLLIFGVSSTDSIVVDNSGNNYAHSKGIIGFDHETAFFLTHSVAGNFNIQVEMKFDFFFSCSL